VSKLTDIVYAGGTDRGRMRQQNEDSILLSEFEHSDVILLLVADGVGGHEGGAVASQLAVQSIQESVAKSVLQAHSGGGYGENWLSHSLQNALLEANQAIIQQQKQTSLSNMATTIVAMLIRGNDFAVCHLGDSRCYRYSEKGLLQITEDHSVLQKLLNQGKIDLQQFEESPMHHMIERALGLSGEPEIVSYESSFTENEICLLCSDGLTNCVSDAQIQYILDSCGALEACVDELITCANDNGGIDNISVVLVRKSHKDIQG